MCVDCVSGKPRQHESVTACGPAFVGDVRALPCPGHLYRPHGPHALSEPPFAPRRGAVRARLCHAHPRPGRSARARGGGAGPDRLGPDRLGQDGGVRPGDGAAAARRRRRRGLRARAAGADHRPDPRARAPGQPRARLALRPGRGPDRDLRRRNGRFEGAAGAPARHPYRRRHSGPASRPSRARARSTCRSCASRARRGGRDARHGLSRGSRGNTRCDPAGAADPALLGDHAAADRRPGQALPEGRPAHLDGGRGARAMATSPIRR